MNQSVNLDEFNPQDVISFDDSLLDPEALANSPLDPIRHAINGSV